MSDKLEGKIALVTGATTGIGLAIAKRFAKEGAHVVITGRRKAELDKPPWRRNRRSRHNRRSGTTAQQAGRPRRPLRAGSRPRKGRLDVVFANAGGGSMLPLGQITEEHYDAPSTAT